MEKLMTRQEYLKDGSNLHHEYYSQFITESTKAYILEEIGIEKLKSSVCEHFNDLYKMSPGAMGTWIWDGTPINMELAKEAKEGNSMATHTCVGKACAKRFLSGEYA